MVRSKSEKVRDVRTCASGEQASKQASNDRAKLMRLQGQGTIRSRESKEENKAQLQNGPSSAVVPS